MLGLPQTTENDKCLCKTSLQFIGLTELLHAINHTTEDFQHIILDFPNIPYCIAVRKWIM